jgi:pimeloyl-ACP methyl ester carboxylesterase
MMIAQRRAVYAGYGTRELYVSGSGRPVVLLHGFADSADCWRPVLERLEAAGRPGVAVDLPNFGEADSLSDTPWLGELNRFVAEVITRHGADQPVIVVGNSLGGLLTVRAAEESRALPVWGIVAIGTAGTGWSRLARLVTSGDRGVFDALAAVPVPSCLLKVAATLATRAVVHGALRGTDPVHVRALSEQFATPRRARRQLSAALILLPEVDAIAALGDIVCPAIIVQGRRDRLVPVAAARRLHAMIPGSRLVILPHSGHCPQVDDPASIVAQIEDLAELHPVQK